MVGLYFVNGQTVYDSLIWYICVDKYTTLLIDASDDAHVALSPI